MDGWKTIVSFWDGFLAGSFRECNKIDLRFFFGSYPVPDCDVGEWRISQRLSECHDLADSTGIEALRN